MIEVPVDRTSDQPAMGCCYNPKCKERSDQERFIFQVPAGSSVVRCPKCGANEPPLVHLLVLTHLLVIHPEGRIKGSGGLMYRVACAEDRAHLATNLNQEAATGDVRHVNCPGCLKVATALGLAGVPAGFEIRVQ